MAEMTDGERIAEERIAEAARTGQDWLDLGDLGLTRLPKNLSELVGLKKLSLGTHFKVTKNGVHPRRPESRPNRLISLEVLSSLFNLTELYVCNTGCSDLSPLSGLKHLEAIYCLETKVADLGPLAGLPNLRYLECGLSHVSDLTPLSGAHELRHLACNATKVSDLTPLYELPRLASLELAACDLRIAPPQIWWKPSLLFLNLSSAKVAGIPAEALGRDCLQRLRAHLTELQSGAEQIHEAKLLILGNGRAGKTQIARRLAGQPFQAEWDSTHGIRITQVTMPAQDSVPETRLKLWDFGGQEIYHGTHALFAKTRAIFLLVWSQETELPEAEPDQHGMVFRNHPLRYWHAYAKDAGHKGSPLIIAQTRLDQDGIRPPPLDQDQVANSLCVQVSTADPPLIGTLRGALQDAVVTLQQSRGVVEIGRPRLMVQQRIEKLRQPDGSLPEEWRLLEKSTFAAWYQEAGGTASAEFALAYLNDNGTVFYREGLFQDRIVLDQNWAMAAIYALFDRKETYGRLQRRGGLFERADLAQVWRDYTKAEQRLFLSMMTSCGICFVYRKGAAGTDESDETLYLAPEFLPEMAVIQGQIDATWGEGPATHRQVFTYAFLHEGLIRNVISHLGTLAQTRADYFRGGVCLYDAQTRARALVMQHLPAGDWQGSVSIETKDGDAGTLLERLAELVSEENRKLNLSATTDSLVLPREVSAPALQAPVIQAARPPEERHKYAISYAWNEKDFTGPDLEAPVNALCDAAATRNVQILRDKQNMKSGDSISVFMRHIARSPRIFVFLSDKYLKSAYCMRELCETWRECRQDAEELKQRVRVFKLPDANISDVHARATYRDYWDQEHQKRSALHQRIGLRGNDLDELDFIEILKHRDLMRILGVFQDTLRHTHIEDFIANAFD